MTYLYDLFTIDDFDGAVDMGYVRLQTHNTEPLTIANYTEKAQFDRVWNPLTLNCRGLIYNRDTLEVAARPYKKFFNHNQPEAPYVGLDEVVSVTDKMDGSLGILYARPSGGWAIATRGSFHSEQALHASHVFNTRYVSWQPAEHLTYLFEIVFPTNRIVCDYGDMDDLVLLGAVGINSGRIYGPREIPAGELWPGPRTEIFEDKTYSEALAMPPRTGKEGIVLRTVDGRMQKIKQEDYIYLHRIITGLNARAVWQLMVDGKSLEECIDGIPDEFHTWVKDVYASISNEVDDTVNTCLVQFNKISDLAKETYDYHVNKKKAFALLAKGLPTSGYLFSLYDGRDIRPEVLKNAKPAADWTPVRVPSEEAA